MHNRCCFCGNWTLNQLFHVVFAVTNSDLMIWQTDYCYTTCIQLECDMIHNQYILCIHIHTRTLTLSLRDSWINTASFAGPLSFDMSLAISLIRSSSSSVASSSEATAPDDVVVSVDVVCIFARTFFFAKVYHKWVCGSNALVEYDLERYTGNNFLKCRLCVQIPMGWSRNCC